MTCTELINGRSINFPSTNLTFQREKGKSALLVETEGEPKVSFCLKTERPIELSLVENNLKLKLDPVDKLYDLPNDPRRITLFFFDLSKPNSTLEIKRDGTGIGIADVRDIFRTGTRNINFDLKRTAFRLWETTVAKSGSEVPAFVMSFPPDAEIVESI